MNLLSVAFALLLTFLLVLARILLLLALFPHDPRFLPACPWSFLSSCSYFPTAHTNTRQHSSTDSVVASIASAPPNPRGANPPRALGQRSQQNLHDKMAEKPFSHAKPTLGVRVSSTSQNRRGSAYQVSDSGLPTAWQPGMT